MGVVTIRNVDDDVIAALKARARANHRSLEGELRYLLARSAAPRPSLGIVRERARMATRYRADSTIAATASDVRATEADAAGPTVGAPLVDGSGAWIGAMSDVGEIVGDIVSPAVEPSDWEALGSDIRGPDHSDIGGSNDIDRP